MVHLHTTFNLFCCHMTANMNILVAILLLSPGLLLGVNSEEVGNNGSLLNSTDPNQDMYVIHAMVYQVGIITNKTDNQTENLSAGGQQEAVTFYHTNGTNIDLSKLPEPLLTNVTAQTIVGIAPTDNSTTFPPNAQSPWSTWDRLATLHLPSHTAVSDNTESQISGSITPREDRSDKTGLSKRSLRYNFKRDVSENKAPVTIVNGAAVIPPEARVQSLAIPALLTLNNNLSHIPVPIPNTSVVYYAKINTLVGMP